MTSRKKDSRPMSRRRLPVAVQRCVTEALEERRLFAVSLVSVGLGGAPADGESGEASVSANGRYVVFNSYATNLVAGDTNGKRDVFLRDLQTGTTTLISRNPSNGEIGNADSAQAVINADGTYVAFQSKASNLLPGDTNNSNDIFRYNIATGGLELVSVRNGTTNVYGEGGSGEPTISKDGHLVSFTSFASNLNAGGADKTNDVYVRNMGPSSVFGISPNQTELVSVINGTTADADAQHSFDSWISQDGRYIAFRSDGKLSANDVNDTRDTYLRDLQANTTVLVSQNPDGQSGNANSESNSISGDGRYVAFQSRASDLVPNDGNANTDVFLRDMTTGKTTLLSVNRFGTNSAGGASAFPAFSLDGSYASFSSTAGDIVAGDTNGREDVFLRDLARGPLTMLSVNTAGQPSNGRSYDPFISRNGDFVVFTSDASDMTAGDTNGKKDIFIATAPNPATDAAPPTAAVAGAETVSPGATSAQFTVNLSDNVGLNTNNLGGLTVTKAGGGTFAATLVSVVGTGTSAVATYRIDFPSGINTGDTGAYSVAATANAIRDAAGNAVAAGTDLGSFTLSTGDPNGPDLNIVKPGKVKPSVIGGANGKFKWKVQNSGPGTLVNQPIAFGVYLSADATLDAGDTAVGTVNKQMKKLKPGKMKPAALKFAFPNNIGDGNYYVLVKADAANVIAESNEINNSGTSATTVLVQQPFVDLQPTVVSKPSKFTAGTAMTATAVVKNNGNVPLKGQVPVTLVITADGNVDGGQVVTTTTQNLNIKPGKTKTIKFSGTIPAGLAAGAYQLGVNVDSNNTFAESDEGNNQATSFQFNTFAAQ